MTISPQYYYWQNFRCGYTVNQLNQFLPQAPAIVLIHPVGVGLSGIFWERFIQTWLAQNPHNIVYNPDLLGCGTSDMPAVAYYPVDWAAQLQYFLDNVVKQPVVLIVQGASLPIAIKLIQNYPQSNLIKGLILSAPPAWRTMSDRAKPLSQKLFWNLLFNSPLGLGKLFYLYAQRRQFIESFSVRQLFADAQQVDDNWLDKLTAGGKNLQSRYAVFSFLAGFWREDYSQAIAEIQQPTLVVFGEQSSSISREGKQETVQERLSNYTKHLPQGQGAIIPGRNVLPYESTSDFVKVASDFVRQLQIR